MSQKHVYNYTQMYENIPFIYKYEPKPPRKQNVCLVALTPCSYPVTHSGPGSLRADTVILLTGHS